MPYQHGVYTSEVETSLTTAPAVDASLPFVIGASPSAFGPRVISSWRQFYEVAGVDDADLTPGDDGWFSLSLVSFAYFWFRIAGRGECIMQGLESTGLTDHVSDLSTNDILNALDSLDTLYEQTRRTPSLLVVPYFAKTAAIQAAMASKMEQYGGRFKGLALCDIPSSKQALSDQTVYPIVDPDDALAAKTTVSPCLAACWPHCGVDNLRFDMSTVLAAVMNRVDGENGDLPFVSPSNKNCYATGLYTDDKEAEAVFLNRDKVNTSLDGNGIVSALNTASGWVIWGNNTTAFPGSTDVKDYLIPIRRMFNYVQNLFQIFAASRIDNPLNRRQLEGVVNSFNQVLASLQGFGALNAASVELDDERNTTAQLIAGVVYFRIRIAPPPPMKEIHGVFEYDVVGFEAAIA